MGLTETIVHEVGELVYLIAPVSPIEPSAAEIEEYAYGKSIVDDAASSAPNPFIKWFSGHYVEADHANGNGAMWTAREVALKSMTPRLMPVSVMHDPSTAVGLIADVALRTPEADHVQRAKLDTALAIWAHRFPGVVEEAQENYRLGTLMQSMECLAPAYECADCGIGYLKLPHGAEQANWCDHLRSENGRRILRHTTFTGTGLIFGSRGATGADPLAHLEDFKQEVAEFHQRGTAVSKPSVRSKPSMDEITLSKSEYDALLKRPTGEQLETAINERDRAVKEHEAVETEAVRLRKEIEDAKAEVARFEEQANQDTLREDRMGKLGDAFVAALGDSTRDRLRKQAGTMQDEEWTERVTELAELVKVTADAKLDPSAVPAPTPAGGGTPAPGSGTPTFTAEEVARQQLKGGAQPTTPASLSSETFRGLVGRSRSTTKAAR